MAYITLNKKHFFNNLDIIAQQTKSRDKIALVLKDNAYGHGLLEVATMAKEYGITKAVVRSYDEAKRVEDLFNYILVLADISKEKSEKIHYTINDIGLISKYAQGTKVELKVNTGMNRNGIARDELREAFESIVKAGLVLKAVFMHHSSADEDMSIFKEQNESFTQVKQEAKALAKEFSIEELCFHSCNSAALFQIKNFEEDMARVGIGAYGCLELEENTLVDELQPVLSLYAKRNSLQKLKVGDAVGYGATFIASEDMSIGNYDFGYGDGFLRSCSSGYKTPEGIELLGRISMDNSSFLSQKEELLIFNDAREVAKSAGTISYEIVTALKENLKRVVL
jgi:alanine racemase